MPIYRKVYGHLIMEDSFDKGLLDAYHPQTDQSVNWQIWIAQLDTTTCLMCREKHGQIYESSEIVNPAPPLHPNCRCVIEAMDAIKAGFGTRDGQNGADWWIIMYGVLPDYYISRDDIKGLGWKPGKSPSKYAPGKMITGGVYRNDDGHLPDIYGRVWYEADINYYSGGRNMHRIVYSNDGLVFVTYDHYTTFYEITAPESTGSDRKSLLQAFDPYPYII